MSVEKKYAELTERRAALDKRSAEGDRVARADKSKVTAEIRAIEREGAREGRVLSVTLSPDGKATVHVEETPTKRERQREYVRHFEERDGKGAEAHVVKLKDRPGGEAYETTVAAWHKKRLFGGK